MSIVSLKQLLSSVIDIAQSSAAIMTQPNTLDIIQKEGHANFVTNIDLLIQSTSSKALLELLPGSCLFAEEEDHPILTDAYTWIIDPIDGTNNFIRNYQHSCISIGLAHQKEVILGVVYNPYLKETFYATKDHGSFCNEQPIHVSTTKIENALLSVGTSLYDRGLADETFRVCKELFLQVGDIRRSGSAALDLCYVASGRTDGFYEAMLSPWDYAAATIIIQEAGGTIGSIHPNKFTLEHRIPVIAGNEWLYPFIDAITKPQ